MKITDIFIQRPVLATVVSLLIFTLGLRSAGLLPIRQFPFTENGLVTVTTTFYGASPDVIAGYITTPLETSIAQADGIDYMTSTSSQNTSVIQVWLRLNYDSIKATNDISTKVNAVLNQLPKQTQVPVITLAIGEPIDAMYLAFYSSTLKNNQITDYLIRAIQPKVQSLEGVQQAEIIGKRQFAMRAWMDPDKISAYGITAADIFNALGNNDFVSASGRTDGQMMTVNMSANTDLHTVDQFKNLIIKAQNGAIVRLQDIGHISLGAEDYNTIVRFNNQAAVYLGVKVAPRANLLDVLNEVKSLYPTIKKNLPKGIETKIAYDVSSYVNSSIHEVLVSLIEALIIVAIVIFLFLGAFRSVIIPAIAIPLSLIGTFFMMLVFGYSINLLTLLALVLAIGLVVDDAIIVVENVERHIEEGKTPFAAALQGARELANPIIAITVVLVAVYLPIGFMGGLTGALFTEFAFTLAGAVAISAVVALTLSPMMCAKFFKPIENHAAQKHPFITYINRHFDNLRAVYEKALHHSLDFLPVTAVFATIILASIYFLYATSKSELAPTEDQGVILAQVLAAPNASLWQTDLFTKAIAKEYMGFSETDRVFALNGINGLNSSIVGWALKSWDKRKTTTMQLTPIAQNILDNTSGIKAAAYNRAPLPGGGLGLPVQFVIQTIEPFISLNEVAQEVIRQAQASGQFLYLDSDLKIDKRQTAIELDRDKASLLGLNMADLSNILSANLSENYVNYFSMSGRSYKVIPQVVRDFRSEP